MSRGRIEFRAPSLCEIATLGDIAVILFLCGCLLVIVIFFREPHNFLIVEGDPRWMGPVPKVETIPSWLLIGLTAVLPALVLFLLQLFIPSASKRRVVIFLVIGQIITNLVVEIIKKYVGRPRPFFFYKTNYKGYRQAWDSGDYTAYFAAITPGMPIDRAHCLDKDGIREAEESFPSGHSATAFFGMIYLSLELLRIFEVLRIDAAIGHFVFGLNLALGAFIAATRVHDYFHEASDVAFGGMIGIAVAVVCARMAATQRTLDPDEGRNLEVDEGDSEVVGLRVTRSSVTSHGTSSAIH